MSVRHGRPRVWGALAVVVAGVWLGACDDQRRAISADDLPPPPEPVVEFVVDADGIRPAEAGPFAPGATIRIVVDVDSVRITDDELPLDTGELLDGESVLVAFDDPGIYELEAGGASATLRIEAGAGDTES